MNIADALANAARVLDGAGVADPRREAASLLALALDKSNTFLIAHPEYDLSTDEQSLFSSYVTRREKREPFQYIAGKQEFYGLDFEVTPAVLIPRPETEILVEEAIKELQKLENPGFCEIGIGSGCISVSILKNVRTATAVATDISPTATEVASRNAERHGVADRLKIIEGDLLAGIEDKFDMIVSNPPYIPESDLLRIQSEVGQFEPHSALFSGEDGLALIRRLIGEAPSRLTSGGSLLIEIGIDQSDKLRGQFALSDWYESEFFKDLQGIERTLKVRRR